MMLHKNIWFSLMYVIKYLFHVFGMNCKGSERWFPAVQKAGSFNIGDSPPQEEAGSINIGAAVGSPFCINKHLRKAHKCPQ